PSPRRAWRRGTAFPAPARDRHRRPPRCRWRGRRTRSPLGGFAAGLGLTGGALLGVLLVLLLLLGQFALAFFKGIIGLCHVCSRVVEAPVYVPGAEGARNGASAKLPRRGCDARFRPARCLDRRPPGPPAGRGRGLLPWPGTAPRRQPAAG